MGQLIAVCGLDCAACDAYIATQAKDEAAKEKVSAKWRVEYNTPGITAKSVTCDGCLASSGILCSHCSECEPRLCAVGRGLANCGLCPDYGCEKISGLLQYIPDAKARMDAIHANLKIPIVGCSKGMPAGNLVCRPFLFLQILPFKRL